MEVAKKQRGIIESIQDDIYKLQLRILPDQSEEQNLGNATARSILEQRQINSSIDKNIKSITSDEEIQYYRRSSEESKMRSYVPSRPGNSNVGKILDRNTTNSSG